ncbi:hypothetical protein RHD99_05560 [Buttiauxella selenatireducens]|uniref:Tail fiber protein n=1 Tax=Buttiauxella selenatireducens TaxID=3073902 RepID=A0ABY9SG91_9ENTR|nr:hypothetical protein [Buttiauxella sp. R73]WMY75426.1 hypothetical protein RHD99_05560 [Buttiauxella sp. R73]
MATVDDDLAKAVTEAFRQARIDISNQDKLLTGPDDVEIELANGQKKTGPSWPKLVKLATDADLPAFTTVAAQVHSDATQVAADKVTAGASKDAAKISETNAKTSETNSASRAAAALASQNAAKTSETNSAASAASAKADADRAQLANPDNWESAPFPDVWIPFNDSLQMLAGNGPYDRITIGSDYLELPSRSATFTRASTATYIDKSGVLQTAAINEPRFEKEGLLIEGQSTNLLRTSSFASSLGTWGEPNATGNVKTFGQLAPDSTSTALKMTVAGDGINTSDANPMVVGTTYTLSFWVKNESDSEIIFFIRFGSGDTSGTFVTVQNTSTWARYVVTKAFATGDSILRLYVNTKGKEFSLWGIQLEALSFATSYIPTNGAAATRAPDNCNIQSALNLPALGMPYTVTLECNYMGIGSGFRAHAYGDQVTYIYTDATSANIQFFSNEKVALLTPAQATPGSMLVRGVMADRDNNNAKYLNNGSVGNMNGNMTKTRVYSQNVGIGNTGSNNQHLYGHIRNFRIWHRALTDAQLKSLR